MVYVALHTANCYHFLNSLFFPSPALYVRRKGLVKGKRGKCEAVRTIDRVEYKGMQYPKRGAEKKINSPLTK